MKRIDDELHFKVGDEWFRLGDHVYIDNQDTLLDPMIAVCQIDAFWEHKKHLLAEISPVLSNAFKIRLPATRLRRAQHSVMYSRPDKDKPAVVTIYPREIKHDVVQAACEDYFRGSHGAG